MVSYAAFPQLGDALQTSVGQCCSVPLALFVLYVAWTSMGAGFGYLIGTHMRKRCQAAVDVVLSLQGSHLIQVHTGSNTVVAVVNEQHNNINNISIRQDNQVKCI